MKYRVIDNHIIPKNTRAEYLYNTYCLDKALTPQTFVESVKTAYYKYDAYGYQPDYVKTLKPSFSAFLQNLSEGGVIVDIGAGTGASYWLVKNSEYEFSKYYFVEPFQSMIDQFDDKNNSKVVIVNDYFESKKCTELVREVKKPKIFIMCGVLRILDNINEFIDILKQNMQQGDKFFLPVEPNNEYFGKYYKFMLTIMIPYIITVRVYRKVKQLLLKVNKHNKGDQDNVDGMTKVLHNLQKAGVVNDKFTTTMLYAIVNYNNYLCWRSIDIPDQYNEGFFTIDQVAERLGCKVTQFNSRTYLYGVSFGVPILDNYIENILKKIFPNKGSTFSAVMTKL
jgi:ubiquinone/menaquinone biosynthesis C-methylase UbiE